MSQSLTTEDSTHSTKIPNHIAVIMDGNGRWATARNLSRIEGHRAGGKSVRRFVETSIKRGIKYVTLFSFSTENWNRGEFEVGNLMGLFKEYLVESIPDLIEHGIRLHAIGDLAGLPDGVRQALEHDIEISKNNTKLHLILALNYGGREEIVSATKLIAEKVKNNEITPNEITQEMVCQSLWTSGIPDPDLLIRTSGEVRLSNFLLWQLAYSEIVVVDKLWPDFTEEVYDQCLEEYYRRERRFGYTSEQIKEGKHFETAKKFGYCLSN